MLRRGGEAAVEAEFNRLLEVLNELPESGSETPEAARLECALRHIYTFFRIPLRVAEVLQLLNPADQFYFLMDSRCKITPENLTYFTRQLGDLVFRARFVVENKKHVNSANLTELAILLVPEGLYEFYESRYFFISSHINKVNKYNFAKIVSILPAHRQEKFIDDKGKYIFADNITKIMLFIPSDRLESFLKQFRHCINVTNIKTIRDAGISLDCLSTVMGSIDIDSLLLPSTWEERSTEEKNELRSDDFSISRPLEFGTHQGYSYCRFQFGTHTQILSFNPDTIEPLPETYGLPTNIYN